jgi:hypothetical protein
MKKSIISIIMLLLIATSCKKLSENNPDAIILTGIKVSKGIEMTTIKIDSGLISSVPIDCYNFGSTVFDPKSGAYGYSKCDKVFVMIDPITGETLKHIQLSGDLTQTVIDTSENILIGRLSIFSTSYVIRIDLGNCTYLSGNPIDIEEGISASSYYYNSNDKEFVLLRSDNTLISIDPMTGSINKSLPVGHFIDNISYIPANNTIICRSYSSENNKNYIEVIDAETGTQLSKKEINPNNDYYYSSVSGYDYETNCYIQVNNKDEVLFIEVSTGEVIKSYKLDAPMNDIKFWKR